MGEPPKDIQAGVVSKDEQFAQAVHAMSKEPGGAVVGFAYSVDALVKPSEYDRLSSPEQGLARMAAFGVKTANITSEVAWSLEKERIAFRLAETAAGRRERLAMGPYLPSASELEEAKQGIDYLELTDERQQQEFRARMANSFVGAAKAVKQLVVGRAVSPENVNAAFEVFYRNVNMDEAKWTPDETATFGYLQELADKVRASATPNLSS
ncbi:hypothetical protein FJZ40_05140 [Candidatus Shapirobacteria bacterium]|nr:hypothetical protein [Candidatus Shapirobacteria bacterium]